MRQTLRPQALANANPNSRVGRIAASRDAVLGRADLLSKYELTRAELDATTPPARDPDAISVDLAQLDADAGLVAGDLAAARAGLAAAPVGTDTTALQAEIETLEGEIEAISSSGPQCRMNLTRQMTMLTWSTKKPNCVTLSPINPSWNRTCWKRLPTRLSLPVS